MNLVELWTGIGVTTSSDNITLGWGLCSSGNSGREHQGQLTECLQSLPPFLVSPICTEKPPEHLVYINAKPIVSASGSEEFTPLSPAASPLLLMVLQEHGQRARPPSTKFAELGWYLGDGCKLFPFSSLSVTAETAWEKRFHFWSWPAVTFVLNYIYFCVSKSFQSEYQV